MGWFAKYVARQFGNPSGVGGTIVHYIMNRQNRPQYGAVLDNIHIRPDDVVLDIGFGNGYLIRKLLDKNPRKVCGIEVSRDMPDRVGRKLKRPVSEGKLDLRLANVRELPYDDASFDKICTVNTHYFWDNMLGGLAEIYRVLKPGGLFINVFYTKEILDKMPHTRYAYSSYSLDDIIEITEEGGLEVVRIDEIQEGGAFCVVAAKPAASKQLNEMTNEELWQLFPVILSGHRERWKNDFRQEAGLLEEKIGSGHAVRVSHIGSTAVPGLPAKPTIDILLEITEGTDLDELTAAMESIGYIHSPQPHKPAPHMMFMKGYTLSGFQPPVFHVHIRYPGDWDEIYFRDYLIAHPETAEEYGNLKLRLKEQFEYDRDGYTEAKTEFVQRITRLARGGI